MSKKVVGIPVFVVDAPMPKMKPPRKPMTAEELARHMHNAQVWSAATPKDLMVEFDDLPENWKQMYITAAEESIRTLGKD